MKFIYENEKINLKKQDARSNRHSWWRKHQLQEENDILMNQLISCNLS